MKNTSQPRDRRQSLLISTEMSAFLRAAGELNEMPDTAYLRAIIHHYGPTLQDVLESETPLPVQVALKVDDDLIRDNANRLGVSTSVFVRAIILADMQVARLEQLEKVS